MSTHYPALVHKHARKADGIITDSEYSKREIIERLQVDPETVRIIPLGTRPLAPVISDRPRDSILFVGRIEHRKNIGNLIRAFSRMKEKDAQLRLVGPPGAGSSEFRTMALSSGVKDRIIFAGYMNGLELAAEYARARVFVFPSLCEGFGLPLLEAMQHGVPIAASSATSIPEVAGDAAHYFDPQQPEQIASILDRLWSDETERAALTQAGRRRWPMFSWEETARRTIETYRRVAGQ